jgi:hypothetical protein
MENGLYKISNDGKFAYGFKTEAEWLLFEKQNGLANRDAIVRGDITQTSEGARMVKSNCPTMLEAANAFLENRPPRWRNEDQTNKCF